MATLDKIIDFSKLSEYDTKIKIHINEVKGDKNNVAFTHGYTDNSQVSGGDSGAVGDISNRYFSFRDVRTEDDVLTISETENSVSVAFQNTDNGWASTETRVLPTKQYVDENKGDKNNIAFTHNYAGNASGNISNRSFSFADAETGNASLSISEMNDKVRVTFENDLGKDENGDGHIDIITRELPTSQYVNSAISGAGASFSVNTPPPETASSPALK